MQLEMDRPKCEMRGPVPAGGGRSHETRVMGHACGERDTVPDPRLIPHDSSPYPTHTDAA
jgi:hypothetical protein